jgi:hypothetical protein
MRKTNVFLLAYKKGGKIMYEITVKEYPTKNTHTEIQKSAFSR